MVLSISLWSSTLGPPTNKCKHVITKPLCILSWLTFLTMVHNDVLKPPPTELFGFNVGDWIVGDYAELEGAQDKPLIA